LRNEDGDKVIIPNTLILTSQVVNQQPDSQQKLTFVFELPSFTLHDIDEFEQQLIENIQNNVPEFNSQNFSLHILAIQKDALKLEVVLTVEKSNSKEVEKALKQAIVKRTSEIL
jgi:small-conductance mechanosensitive channel